MSRVVGIDLGAARSCVAIMDGAQPIVIGRAAGCATKRRLGHSEAAQQEAGAVMLQLRQLAEDWLGETVTDAVVAVPAHFDDAQRQATRDAARLAGLDVLRIVNEPTAAALAYGAASEAAQRVAVYVVDGGAFDISILERHDGVLRVCATAGDAFLDDEDGAPVIEPFIWRTLALCRGALADAGLAPSEIDALILVGTAARTPRIRDAVSALFGRAPSVRVDADAAVAIGAALQAGVLTGEVQDVVLEVTPLSLGIETAGGVFTRLIPRNTPLPARATAVFSTTLDNQEVVDIHVLQGEREMAGDNKSLAHFELTNIRLAPSGAPKIEVAFELDADGVLAVSARDVDTGHATRVTVSDTALSEGDVQHLVNESLEMAPADQRRRAFAEARNRGEGLLYSSEKAMEEFRGSLSDGERAILVAELAACRTALGQDDLAAVQDAVARLEVAAQRLGEAIYAAAETSGT